MTSTTTDRRFGVNSGVAVKAPCLVTTTASITLSGEQTIDGVACVTGDRVLVKDQTSGVDNGIYIVDTGTWTRAPDFNGSFDAVTGTLVPVNSGSTYQGSVWRLTTTGTISVGTTSLTFTQGFNDAASVTYTPSGTGAIDRTVQAKLREIEVSTEDFDDGEADYAEVITKAFDYAETLLSATSTQPDGANGYASGSIRVKVPKGSYSLSTAIAIPPMVNFEGDGSGNTVLSFTYNGACVTVKSSVAYPYNAKRGRIANMRFVGDLTDTSQDLLSLTRFSYQSMENVEVEKAGRDGIVLTECLGSRFSSVRATGCGRKGWKLTSSAGPLPTIGCNFTNCYGTNNVAEGLDLDEAYGNTFNGGAFDENFDGSTFSSIADSEVATMRQVLISNTSRGNLFLGTWFEGEANAHVYCATSAANATQLAATFAFCHFIPKGTTGNVDRAAVVNKGCVAILYPDWQATAFRTISSSGAPFRVGKANTGRIYLEGVVQTGTSPDIAQMVEDKDGLDGNLSGLATVRDFSGALARVFGRMQLFQEHGQVGLDVYRTSAGSGTDWDEFPYLQFDAANLGLRLGGGTGATDVLLAWIAANRAGVASGDSLETVSGELRVAGDLGGIAGKMSLTSTSDVTANSSGVGTVLFKGTTSRNSSGFIKIYLGTTPYYIPIFSEITG